MSGRFFVLVVVLAFASAAVGAAVALLLQPADSDQQPGTQVAVVAATPSPDAAEQQQPAAAEPERGEVEQSETAESPDPVAEPEQAAAQEQQSVGEVQSLVERQSDAEPAEPSESAEQQAHEEVQEQALDDAEPRFVATIMPNLLRQGGALSLSVESEQAGAVAATIGGRSWNLLETAPGIWWIVIPIPRDAETGTTEIVFDLYGEGGAWIRSAVQSFIVMANAAPFEEVTLGGSGAPADPAAVQRDIAVRFSEHISVSGPPRWAGAWQLPVEGEVTGVFGARRSYDGVEAEGWHHGHDIAAQHGDPIAAPAPGTVVWTGELILHGIGVIIDHGAGVYSGYWHMSLIAVREGMDVAAGDWLGNIGTTGLSTGPHLHWEVIIQGIDVDPVQWLDVGQLPLPPLAEETEQLADTLD